MTGMDGSAGGLAALLAAFLVGVAAGILGMIQVQGSTPAVTGASGPQVVATAAPSFGREGTRDGATADLARIEAALASLRHSTLEACRIKAAPDADPSGSASGADGAEPFPGSVGRGSVDQVAARPTGTLPPVATQEWSRRPPGAGAGPDGRGPPGWADRKAGPPPHVTRPTGDTPRIRGAAPREPRCPPRRSDPGRRPTLATYS